MGQYQEPIPSINSAALENLSFSDTARLNEFFEHTGIAFPATRTFSKFKENANPSWAVQH